MSRIANAIRARLLGDGMRDSGCALKAMRREVACALLPIRTLYSFIPAQAVAAGFRVAQVPVKHRPRQGGTSNYGFRVFAIMPLLDMLGMFWYRKRSVLSVADCQGPES
jgi:dolichol-phosphate mannosyltransferase